MTKGRKQIKHVTVSVIETINNVPEYRGLALVVKHVNYYLQQHEFDQLQQKNVNYQNLLYGELLDHG